MIGAKDILVALKLGVGGWASSRELAVELGLSPSTVTRALSRLRIAGLVRDRRLNRLALVEFLSHGARYLYPTRPGDFVLGLPTAGFSPAMEGHLMGAEPVVIPIAGGPVRGRAVQPICEEAVFAAQGDEQLYKVLSILDSLRVGASRERHIASGVLRECLRAASIS